MIDTDIVADLEKPWTSVAHWQSLGKKAAGEFRALKAENEALRAQNHCCSCGKPVDTREESEGGDPHGSQLTSGLWVCSSECWDSAIDTMSVAQVRKEALEEVRSEVNVFLRDQAARKGATKTPQGRTASWYRRQLDSRIRALIEKEDG